MLPRIRKLKPNLSINQILIILIFITTTTTTTPNFASLMIKEFNHNSPANESSKFVACNSSKQKQVISERILNNSNDILTEDGLTISAQSSIDSPENNRFNPPTMSESIVDPILSPLPFLDQTDHRNQFSMSLDATQNSITTSSHSPQNQNVTNTVKEPNHQVPNNHLQQQAQQQQNSSSIAGVEIKDKSGWESVQISAGSSYPKAQMANDKVVSNPALMEFDQRKATQVNQIYLQPPLPDRQIKFRGFAHMQNPAAASLNPLPFHSHNLNNIHRPKHFRDSTEFHSQSHPSTDNNGNGISKYLRFADLLPFGKNKSRNSIVKSKFPPEDLGALDFDQSNSIARLSSPSSGQNQNLMPAQQVLAYAYSPYNSPTQQLSSDNDPNELSSYAKHQFGDNTNIPSSNDQHSISGAPLFTPDEQQQQQVNMNFVNTKNWREQLDLSDAGKGSHVTYLLQPNKDLSNPISTVIAASQKQPPFNQGQQQRENSNGFKTGSTELDTASLVSALESVLKIAANNQKAQNHLSDSSSNNNYLADNSRINKNYYGPNSHQLMEDSSVLDTYDYPQQRPKKRNQAKKKNPSNPSVKVQKVPRKKSGRHPYGSDSSPNPAFYENPSKDLMPSATFLKHKHPWFNDDEEEEEGETEVNIRFFNNFSRLGSLGHVARAGGSATMIVSLIFLILSNFSLAATVIAHGFSTLLRQLQYNPERIKLKRGAKHFLALHNSTTVSPKTPLFLQTANAVNNSGLSKVTTKKPTNLDEKISSIGSKF